MAARRGRRDRVVPPPSGSPGPDPGGGVRGSSRGCWNQAPYGTVGAVSGGEQVLLHEEVDDSGFVSLSRLGPCLKDKDLEMEELMLQDETLLGTMQSYMDASLISLIEDFGSLGESRLSLEDQNEVSLLTALTEILDNADSENLSPFDSIPDSELLVSPREGSSSVEMSLTDSAWDFSPPSFLETSSPKLPSWRPPRSRPRRSQSPSSQQRSDGEEEEEVASFSGQMLAGEHNSLSSIPDFPMHLACPEEEHKTAAAEMAVQAAGDESISSLSELVRAMHPSPRRRSDRRRRYSSYRSHDHYQRQRVLQKERAIEERRVVFIGKIPGRMTRSELKQRFSVFGEIEECTIHFRVQGDNYGFVTYRYAEEAFAAIESGHKLRQADEQPFDLCFGGRRQFCKRSYSDLDSNREDFDPAPVKSKFDSLDFDTLLKQAQKNLRR
uniref:Peroxisome proliferator-activated receptor gamma coactivator-related protein 1 n=1 Tax=Molossus molossus TaxID=27622 RepID=A0A7J8DR86_MOLMO|nr:PPARG related coactivator 1 [Molossus molossus]